MFTLSKKCYRNEISCIIYMTATVNQNIIVIARQHSDLWRVHGPSYTAVCIILHLAILVQCRPVTDRQTDGHTMTEYTALASYGKNHPINNSVINGNRYLLLGHSILRQHQNSSNNRPLPLSSEALSVLLHIPPVPHSHPLYMLSHKCKHHSFLKAF